MTLPQKQFLDVFNADCNLRRLTIGFAVAIFFVAQSHAQEKTPRKEFFIKLSKYKIVLAPGEMDSIEVKILRSPFFKDLPIQLSVMGKIPGGITTCIKNPSGGEPGKITFTADADVLSDDCHLIVQGKSLTSRIMSRGSVLQFSSRTNTVRKK